MSARRRLVGAFGHATPSSAATAAATSASTEATAASVSTSEAASIASSEVAAAISTSEIIAATEATAAAASVLSVLIIGEIHSDFPAVQPLVRALFDRALCLLFRGVIHIPEAPGLALLVLYNPGVQHLPAVAEELRHRLGRRVVAQPAHETRHLAFETRLGWRLPIIGRLLLFVFFLFFKANGLWHLLDLLFFLIFIFIILLVTGVLLGLSRLLAGLSGLRRWLFFFRGVLILVIVIVVVV